MNSLHGRTALVTGSSHGVGAAIAEYLARQGADVVIHGLDHEQVEQVRSRCEGLGVRAFGIAADLLADQPHGIQRMVDRAFELAPQLDLLVANAGTYIDVPFLEMTYELLDRTMKLNVYSYFLTVQSVAQRWVEQGREGRVVLVGSINGRLAEDVHVAYDSSKGAVDAMVRSLAVSLAKHKIRVNGMAPGLVLTPLTAPAFANPKFREWMELHTPNGQVPGPEACASTVAYLLSDDAWHVHGQMILVDGGMSAWQQPDLPG